MTPTEINSSSFFNSPFSILHFQITMRYIYLFLVLAAYLVMILVMGWDAYRAFWSAHKVLWGIIDCSVLLPFLLFGSNEHEKQN